MKKRIWIKVDALRLSCLFLGKEKDSAWGPLEVGHDGFKINSLSLTLDKKGSLFQSTSGGSVRLRDVPLLYKVKNRPVPEPLLYEVIGMAVCNEYLQSRKDQVTAFIKECAKVDFPWFTPADWKGSLRIPVDFIRLFNFECHENGPASASIQVGHHLTFWHVSIYDRRDKNPFQCQTREIRDSRVLSAINDLLAKKKVRGYIKRLILSHHAISDGTEFIDKIPGCRTDSLPPRIRFY